MKAGSRGRDVILDSRDPEDPVSVPWLLCWQFQIGPGNEGDGLVAIVGIYPPRPRIIERHSVNGSHDIYAQGRLAKLDDPSPEATAAELEVRIKARVPARALAVRRTRPRKEVLLEARAAEQLGALAIDIARRYDISPESAIKSSAGIRGFRPQPLTDSKGRGRTGASVKGGHATIERFVAYRRGNSFASLAFVLLAGQADGQGRYVLLGTDDVLGAEEAPNDYADVAGQHAWSSASRARMRAEPVAGFDEGAERYEAMIARLATPIQ